MLKSKNCRNGCQSATGQPMGNLLAIQEPTASVASDLARATAVNNCYQDMSSIQGPTGLSAPQLPIGLASCNRLRCHDLCRCGREMEARTEGRRRKDQTGKKKGGARR